MPPRLVALLGALLEAPRHLALDGVDVPRAVVPQEDREDLRRALLGADVRRARDPRLRDARHRGLRALDLPFRDQRRRRDGLEARVVRRCGRSWDLRRVVEYAPDGWFRGACDWLGRRDGRA